MNRGIVIGAELLRRQLELALAAKRARARGIDDQVAEAEHGRKRGLRAPGERADPRHQDGKVERLTYLFRKPPCRPVRSDFGRVLTGRFVVNASGISPPKGQRATRRLSAGSAQGPRFPV